MYIYIIRKNGFQIRIVQQKIHNISKKSLFFDTTLKENNTLSGPEVDSPPPPLPKKQYIIYCQAQTDSR